MTDTRSPRNTTNAISDPADQMMFLAASMGRGGMTDAIGEMESQGQRELLHSEVIPTRVNYGTEEELTALGFQLGERVEGDPMFRRATLPEGWKREGSEHAMWSHIVDQLGRQRISIFYKAAFYDRDAFVSINTVVGQVSDLMWGGEGQLVLDDEWMTRAAVLEAVESLRVQEQERIDLYERVNQPDSVQESRDRMARLDEMKAQV